MNSKQLIKIRDNIVKLKENLNDRQKRLVAIALYVLLPIAILIFIYTPLRARIRNADSQLDTLTTELANQRSKADALKKLILTGRLMKQSEVSSALNEITEQGRAFGLKFISITPYKLERSTEVHARHLPISFIIESEYEGLGQFLAYLEEFPLAITELRGLNVRPGEKRRFNLNTELLVYLYMEAEDEKE
ncbi:MAG: type 4a pilus biogenesis protein PilO [Candidatus Omnitrophota bacterium]|nr:MAG: type 4a pilus biogenesis protein PilO [Candidatus Omnitrophota bacterium]